MLIFISPFNGFAEQNVRIHGFVSQGYLKSSSNNFLAETDKGTFQYNDMGLNFQYFTGDKVSIGAQLGARDLGDVGNDKVGVNWVYGDYKWRDWLGFRAGIMKASSTLYGENRDVDSLHTWIIMPQSLYNEQQRDASQGLKGISLYGNIDMASMGMLKYDLRMADLQVGLDSGTAQTIIASGGVSSVTDISFDTLYAWSLRWKAPIDGLQVGADGAMTGGLFQAISPNPYYDPTNPLFGPETLNISIDTKEVLSTSYSLEYVYRDLILTTEWSISDQKVAYYVTGTPPGSYTKTKATSYYFSASYRFLDWLEMGTYYSKSVADDDERGPDNELKDICLTTRFDITDNMTFKLEAHSMKGTYGVSAGDDGSLDDSWNLFGAKVSYNF